MHSTLDRFVLLEIYEYRLESQKQMKKNDKRTEMNNHFVLCCVNRFPITFAKCIVL